MIKRIAIWAGKKYAVSAVRDIVAAKKDDVQAWSTRIRIWISRLRYVITFFDNLLSRIEDGNFTSEEGQQTIADAKKLAIEVTK